MTTKGHVSIRRWRIILAVPTIDNFMSWVSPRPRQYSRQPSNHFTSSGLGFSPNVFFEHTLQSLSRGDRTTRTLEYFAGTFRPHAVLVSPSQYRCRSPVQLIRRNPPGPRITLQVSQLQWLTQPKPRSSVQRSVSSFQQSQVDRSAPIDGTPQQVHFILAVAKSASMLTSHPPASAYDPEYAAENRSTVSTPNPS